VSSPTLENTTVVVTGASAGIGRAIARRLAPTARVMILVARRLDRLEELARELTAANPRLTTHCLRVDLAEPTELDGLCASLEALGPVDVIVNSAGIGDYGVFDRMSWSRLETMLRLNVVALTRLTHHVVGGMIARRRGFILNVSSGFGLAFTPAFAAYIGTKHYVSGFTEGLALDLVGTGVVATHVCPGPVATEFALVTGAPEGMPTIEEAVPRWIMVTPELVADAAVRGLETGRAMVVPGLLMKVLWILNGITPRPITRMVMAPLARLYRQRELEAAAPPKQLSS